MTTPTFAIVGAGLAGAKAAEALREQGFDGAVVLIGAERHLPYERPPLSKGYLNGADDRDSFVVHPRAWYAEHEVELRLGTSVTAIDAVAHRLALEGGAELRYDRLLLATGSSPRRLPVPGADAPNVHYLRTVEDADALRETITPDARVTVIGAGWIGLEVAAAAREAGAAVTVVESAELPLLRVLGAEIAEVFADLHRAHDVDLRLNAQVTEIGTGVRLTDGSDIESSLVVVGIGVAPNVRLAEAAALAVDNGVLVDEALRSSNPDIFAVGDIANAEHPLLGRRIRVEHWANALNQPAVAARAMRGEAAVYDELPYFFTDQYDLGMEYVGYVEPGGYERVVLRGDKAKREFVAFWLDADDRVLAGMNVNVWDVVDDVKALISANHPVDVDILTNPDRPMGDALNH